MTSLAEDLLKSRAIVELRTLIHDLRRDAEGKRSELQSMVGSQYHEFIQSADKISGMNEQSKQLVEKLADFWQQNQQVINHVNQLLGQKNKLQHVVEVSDAEKLLEEIHPTLIWRDLSTCDIYAASLKTVTAHCILQHLDGKSSHFTEEVVSTNMKTVLSNMNTHINRIRDLRSSSFLIETISDDARIFCLEDGEGEIGLVEQKAKALASLEVLTTLKTDDSAVHQANNVIDIYLHCADLRLQHLFDTKLRNAGERDQSAIDIESGLISLVHLLQTIIVDIYVLFFCHIPIGEDKSVTGLVSYYHLKLLQDVNGKFSHTALSSFWSHLDINGQKQHLKAARTWLQDQIKGVTEKCSALLSSLTSAMQVAQLQQQVYSNCISVASSSVSVTTASSHLEMPAYSTIWNDACNELLVHKSAKHKRVVSNSQPNNAIDTALLLWSTVFRASFLHQVERLLQKSCEDTLHEVQDQLVQIIGSFGVVVDLNHHHPHANAIVKVGDRPSLASKLTSAKIYMLAERIRSYFDSALGKLLDDVITPVHQSELQLQQQQQNHSNGQSNTSALSGQASMSALKSNCAKLVGQFLSSLRRISEACKTSLMMQGCLQFPDYEGDKFDVKDPILHANVSKVLKSHFNSTNKFQSNAVDHGNHQEEGYMFTLLLIGRISWLMKIRSNATKSALMDTQMNSHGGSSKNRSISSLHAPSVDLEVIDSSLVNTSNVSEEQFRSAFEIADTDGDGVVERSEALEALQALSVGDQFTEILSDQHASSHAKNSLSSVSSLSYEEFVLVFGAHLFSADLFKPFQRLTAALDHIISYSHMVWIVSLIKKQSSDLHKSILQELCLEKSAADKHQSTAAAPFKVHWAPKWIDLDGSADDRNGDKVKEQIMLPSRCSTSSNQFIYDISSTINHFLVSIDTMQAWWSEDNNNIKKLGSFDLDDMDDDSEESKWIWANLLMQNSQQSLVLCKSLSTLAYEIALDQLRHAYNHAIQSLVKSSGVVRKQESIDDIAMQIVVDLMVYDNLSQGMFGKVAGNNGAKVKPFDRLLKRARANLDPVMAELASQPLQQSVDKIIEKTRLLFFPNVHHSMQYHSDVTSSNTYTSSSNISQEVLGKLFPPMSSSSTRCALLPLALTTTHSPMNSSISNSSQANGNKKSFEKSATPQKAGVPTNAVNDKNKSTSNIMKWW